MANKKTVEFDVQDTLARFEMVQSTIADLKPVWERAIHEVQEVAAAQFESEGKAYADSGPGWAPRSATTLDIYNRQGLTPGLVGTLTGRLMESLTVPGDPDSYEYITQQGFVFGSTVSHNGINYGDVFSQGRLLKSMEEVPARPIFTTEAQEYIAIRVSEDLVATMNAAFSRKGVTVETINAAY